MKKLVLVMILLCLFPITVFAEEYPEFDGHYIYNNGKWVELLKYELDYIFWTPGKGITLLENQPGCLGLPEAIRINDKRPRFLVVTSNSKYAPNYEALIELRERPFDNRQVGAVNDKKYGGKIKYNAQNFKKKIWVLKREVRLKSKTVQGRTGTFIFEPSENLDDGLYALDFGPPNEKGHNLKINDTMSYVAGEHRSINPFLVGNVKDNAISTDKKSGSDGTKNLDDANANNDQGQSSNGGELAKKAIGGLFNVLKNRK